MTNRTKNLIIAGVFLAILLATMYFSCEHGRNSILKQTGIDTVVTVTKTDTVYKPQVTTITTTNTVYVPRTNFDTLWGEPEIIIEPTDTAAILADYNSTIFYRDEQRLPRGTVTIEDSVRRNRIVSRKLQTFNTDTTIKSVTILRPPRNIVLSFTTSLLGNIKQPLYGQGAGFNLKLPNDASYQFEVFRVTDQPMMFQITKTWPIKLGKRK